MYHSKELPENPLELDGAGAVADIGLHDQVVLVTRSQDHSSAVCTVTKLLVITANTNTIAPVRQITRQTLLDLAELATHGLVS